ncbi:hypothetical protein, partial [Acinetobacter baumannii]|uniref:hypothetical protein n=1 Tax=Acinetobacter baumannii TaxID=470 RepID=UPI00227CDF7F
DADVTLTIDTTPQDLITAITVPEDQGNVDVADADVTVTVDTVPADLIGAITIPEDLNGDGILNADELGT